MENPRIVYVEDEKDYRILVAEILEEAGLSVNVAENGKDGLRLLADQNPDLLLLDIHLPDTDGFSLCRELRQDARWKDFPILMLTVLHKPEEWRTGFSSGATDYVTKPLNPPDFLERVQSCLFKGNAPRTGQETDEYPMIRAALAGNRGVFDALVRQHKPALLSRIIQQTKNVAEAEDIVASAFMKAFEKLSEFRGSASFNTWLYTIALHELYRRSRGPGSYSLDALLDDEDSPLPHGLTMMDAEPPIEDLELAKVNRMLASLPKKYQKVLQLNVMEGITMENLSLRWRMPLASVKWRVAMAKRLLRDAWERSRYQAN